MDYRSRPILTDKLNPATRAAVVRELKQTLGGVGMIPSAVQRGVTAFHYRRSLTDEELAGLAPEWCAIPPVDEGGDGEILEQDT
jgi:hypothetical protein